MEVSFGPPVSSDERKNFLLEVYPDWADFDWSEDIVPPIERSVETFFGSPKFPFQFWVES